MGFFDAIKKAFDSGGIKVRLDAPGSFTFSEGSIPATVMLTGHKTEPRIVTELIFTFREDSDDSDSGTSGVSTLTFSHSEAIELQPLQEVAVEVTFPLELDVQATKEAGWVGGLMKAIGTISQNATWYRLTVSAVVEGAGANKSASRRLRRSGLSTGASIAFS